MILIDNFAGCATMAPEFATEVLLQSLGIMAGVRQYDSSAILLINDDCVRQFMLASGDIKTPKGRVKAETVKDLAAYMKGMAAALEDCESLCGFDRFGEFILNSVLLFAQKRMEKEHIRWNTPGTYVSREIFFNEAMAICRHMNTMMPDDEQYSEVDFAIRMCSDFMNIGTMVRGTSGGDLLFRHQEDAIVSWDPAKEAVPQFSITAMSVAEVYGEDNDENDGRMTTFELIGG